MPGTIGIDMGSTNMMLGYLNTDMKFVACWQFKNTITELVDNKGVPLHVRIRRFKKEFISYLDKWKPRRVMAERFMPRGIRGTLIEVVNIMIGVMAAICVRRKINFRVLTASTWKNSLNKRFRRTKNDNPLNRLYKAFKIKQRHYIDAMLIAHYRNDPKFTALQSVNSTIKKLTRPISKLEA